jgi:predicted Zn-dependent protease
MRRLVTLAVLALAACASPPQGPAPVTYAPTPMPTQSGAVLDADAAMNNFASVAINMEPAIEAECRARSPRANCDFQIVVDTRPDQPPNAYQTLDRSGRPIVAFNLGLIADARNVDELAFVMGHEAAHHIAAHIPRQQETALRGALLGGLIAAATGADPETVRTAQNVGATVGARRYSQDFELEADALGTVIAWDAGYDPERGAAFFGRLPDPGNQFLGTHPPNARRIDTVRQTLATLR